MYTVSQKDGQDLPDDSKSERGINMDEQRRDFVRIVEHQTISPGNDSAGQRPMGQTIAGYPQRYVRGEYP